MGYEPWLRKSHQKSNLFLIRRRIVIVAAAPCRRPRRLRFVAVTDNPWRDGMKGGWCRVNLETIHLFGPERSRRLGIINYKKICNFPQNKFGEQCFLHRAASGRSWQRSIIRRIVLFVEKGPSGSSSSSRFAQQPRNEDEMQIQLLAKEWLREQTQTEEEEKEGRSHCPFAVFFQCVKCLLISSSLQLE